MLRSLCSCFADVSEEKKSEASADQLTFDEAARLRILSLKARRKLLKDAASKVEATVFDEEVPSEDEDGEENLVLGDGAFGGQSFSALHSHCMSSGTLFVDPMFPPSDVSLVLNKTADPSIEWKRPKDIYEDPKFFVDGGSRFDVKQGELGDCWLLAAIANLTMHKNLFQKVVPHDQSFREGDYAGIFHFRFWQYGEWVDVVVDDFLPTRYGQLVYMRSETKQEFWSALLEKAYAKLHGSYSALRGGTTAEAMVDFSGGCSEQYTLSQAPKDIYNVMIKAFKRSSMMACSVEPDPRVFEAKTRSGLVRGHAYSLTKVVKAPVDTRRKKGLIPLIRLRNPWGNDTEWKGAWSDGAREWQFIPEGEEREALGLTFDADGEFYMAQRDFMREFDSLEICNLGPEGVDHEEQEALGKLTWCERRFDGSWIAGDTAGGCRNFLDTFASNPQFKVVLTDSDEDDDLLCTCVISLMQKGSRKKKALKQGQGCLTIGFAVYRVDDPSSTKFPLDTDFFRYHLSTAKPKSFINLREVTARFKLPPGTYVIIPSTFEPNSEGDFLLRVFSEADSNVECVNRTGTEE